VKDSEDISELDPPRRLLMQLVQANGLNLKTASIIAGMNSTYLQKYVWDGTPRQINETARDKLAVALGVRSEALKTGELGPEDTLDRDRDDGFEIDDDLDGRRVTLPEFNVRFSAGGGSLTDDSRLRATWALPNGYASEMRIDPRNVVIAEVIGDSMEPYLRSGDRIGIDQQDVNPANPGVFALWDSDALVVKRLEKVPNTDPVELKMVSDNPNHTTYQVPLEHTNILGRVVILIRRL
jgi:phage repressor protein C with HTH and peptisase S24 domain